jgi:hypothetical protein
MAGKKRDVSIGARNPYALAELIQGKKIDWKKKSYDRSVSILENAFGMAAEKLYNPKYNSPLFNKKFNLDLPPIPPIPPIDPEAGRIISYEVIEPWEPFNGEYVNSNGEGKTVKKPIQSGLLTNCSLIAAIASCAWTKKPPVSTAQELPPPYCYSFYDYNNPQYDTSSSELLPQINGKLIYAKSSDPNECWPGMIEKAYYQSREHIQFVDNDKPDYIKFNQDDPNNPTKDPKAVLKQLTNVEPVYKYAKTTPDNFQFIKGLCTGVAPNLRIKYPAVAWTYDVEQANYPMNDGTIALKHTYSLLGVTGAVSKGVFTSKYIVLRNPWGPSAQSPDPQLTATSLFTDTPWFGINLADADGIFALRADLFPMYFDQYAWVVT